MFNQDTIPSPYFTGGEYTPRPPPMYGLRSSQSDNYGSVPSGCPYIHHMGRCINNIIISQQYLKDKYIIQLLIQTQEIKNPECG